MRILVESVTPSAVCTDQLEYVGGAQSQASYLRGISYALQSHRQHLPILSSDGQHSFERTGGHAVHTNQLTGQHAR